MRTKAIAMAGALAALGLASGSAKAAQQLYAGELVSIVDTSAGNCGQPVGEHTFLLYRPKGDGTMPAGMIMDFGGVHGYVQSADASGEFFSDGTKGKMTGTILLGTTGNGTVTRGTMNAATYTFKVDKTDPDWWKITKMTLRFTIKEISQLCNFTFDGVATPMRMPAP